MSDLTFIKNLPSEFTGYHFLPANTRYPCDWGYTEVKQVYRILQLIGNGEYIFLVTDSEFSYWGHSDKFETANKLGQDYGQEVKEQTVRNTIKGRLPEYLKPLFILSSATYQTNDKTASYRIATVSKSSNVSTATDSTFLVLDTRNNYRGLADSELRACELAELIIQKPILQKMHTYR